jgi:hypothetical protein
MPTPPALHALAPRHHTTTHHESEQVFNQPASIRHRWIQDELWVQEREAIMHLLAPFHASFMYGQHRFGAAFQAVEALHHTPRFTGR